MNSFWQYAIAGLGITIFVIAAGFWLLGFVSSIMVQCAYHRYMKAAHPELGAFRRSFRFNDLVWNSEKLRSELEADQSGAIAMLFRWRERLVFAVSGFVTLVVGTVILGLLAKFLIYIYVKGQQAG